MKTMQPMGYQRNFCDGNLFFWYRRRADCLFYLAREILSDRELRRLTEKYHARHPNLSIELQERTCNLININCIYHYRHIEVRFNGRCFYNELSQRFRVQWTIDQLDYHAMFVPISRNFTSISTCNTLTNQIEAIIEHMTNHFMQSNTNESQTQRTVTNSPAKIDANRPLLSRRGNLVQRSLSWSQPINARPARNATTKFIIELDKKI